MKLYVCWGTLQTPRPGGHPCHNANQALIDAGYEPEVIRVHGLGIGPLKWAHPRTTAATASASASSP